MKHFGLISLLLIAVTAYAQQEVVSFQPPHAYDMQRYEAGWNKNPFTLKTAAPVVESVSFAMDLAIGTYYGDSADPTIIIVNTKTNERIRLKKDQPAANGMKLNSVKVGGSRKDVMVEVTLGTETAAIRFNDSYVKQMAAAEMTKAPATQQQTRQPPGAPSKMPLPPTPSQPGKGPTSGNPPANAQTIPVSPGRPGFAPPSVTRPAMNRPPTNVAQLGAAPIVPQATGVNGVPSGPPRRRLIVPTGNAAPNSQ